MNLPMITNLDTCPSLECKGHLQLLPPPLIPSNCTPISPLHMHKNDSQPSYIQIPSSVSTQRHPPITHLPKPHPRFPIPLITKPTSNTSTLSPLPLHPILLYQPPVSLKCHLTALNHDSQLARFALLVPPFFVRGHGGLLDAAVEV